MKAFCRKHIVIYTLGIICIALFSSLMTNFLQSFFPENRMMYFLMEAIVKFSISSVLLVTMVKWGYTKKADKKNIFLGFLLCSPLLFLILQNVLPLVLINPILFKIQWGNLLAIILLFLSVGLLEETTIRGLLLPLLCEKWENKKHSYLKAAIFSSLIFGFVHFTHSVSYFISYGYVPLNLLLGNLSQVFYAFCFGLFASGVAMYSRNIISLILFHALWDIPALLTYGILPYASAEFYKRQQLLTLQRVFYKYGFLPNFPFTEVIIYYFTHAFFIIVGITLILKAEKKYMKAQ